MKKIRFVLLGHFVLSVALCLMVTKMDESGTIFHFEPEIFAVMGISLIVLNLPGIALFAPLVIMFKLKTFDIGNVDVGFTLLAILTTELCILLTVLLFRKILKLWQAKPNH